MQSQQSRFQRRSVSIVALSVDEPAHSQGLVRRLGLQFPLASDPQQTVVKRFGVQNPDTQELALHAVYIVDAQGKIYYRKVGRRRPTSEELLDAIDAYRGDYPVSEPRKPRPPRSVAWPTNNFQTLLEISASEALPAAFDRSAVEAVLALLVSGKTDDSLIAFKALAGQHARARGASAQQELMRAAGWLTRARFAEDKPEMLQAGTDLQRRLLRVNALEDQLADKNDTSADADQQDQLLQTLGKARGGLALARATVRNNQRVWNLDFAQGMLRSYREVARVMTEDR